MVFLWNFFLDKCVSVCMFVYLAIIYNVFHIVGNSKKIEKPALYGDIPFRIAHIPTYTYGTHRLRIRASELGGSKNTLHTCYFASREIAKEVKLHSQDDTWFETRTKFSVAMLTQHCSESHRVTLKRSCSENQSCAWIERSWYQRRGQLT